MKKSIAVPLALGLLLALAGCAKEITATITEPMLDSQGKVLTDANGAVLTRTKTLPPETGYYEAQKEANQPVVSIKIPAGGESASLPAGTELTFRLPSTVKQYTPESVQLLREVKDAAPWAFGAWTMEKMSEMGRAGISGAKPVTNTISTQGDGSGVIVSGGGTQATTTIAPVTTTTTTTTGAETTGVAQ